MIEYWQKIFHQVLNFMNEDKCSVSMIPLYLGTYNYQCTQMYFVDIWVRILNDVQLGPDMG